MIQKILLIQKRTFELHILKKYLQVCLYHVAGFFELDTKGPVVEKAIGLTHIEMKHPACCTAAQKSFSFLNLQDFLHLIFNTNKLAHENRAQNIQ